MLAHLKTCPMNKRGETHLVQSPIKLHPKRVKRNHCITYVAVCITCIADAGTQFWKNLCWIGRGLWQGVCASRRGLNRAHRPGLRERVKNAARTQCRMRGLKLHPKMAKRHRCILLRVAPPHLLCSCQNCFELGKLATTWHLWLLQIHFKSCRVQRRW